MSSKFLNWEIRRVLGPMSKMVKLKRISVGKKRKKKGLRLCFGSIELDVSVEYTSGKYSVQFSSVAQLCPTLCNPMNHSTPGLPLHHQLPEFTQTHVHRVRDAFRPSHPLLSPSPPAPNPSHHQGLFQ